jgi:release factor glutamine methyltransferase
VKSAVVTAIDLSETAVAVARRNVEKLALAGRVVVEQGDLYEPLKEKVADVQPFHLIVANPPYIPSNQIATLDRNVREYEPVEALDGGLDGLSIHRRILEGAGDRLEPGGRVFLEIAFDQGPPAKEMAGHYTDFEDVRLLKDYGGRDRVLTARRR